MGTGLLRAIFSRLFACCDNQFATVEGVRHAEGWRIRFQRPLGMEEAVEWNNLCRIFDVSPMSGPGDRMRCPELWRPPVATPRTSST
jgi:hypothetical protein